MSKSYEIIDHKYEVIVIGAGGAGLRAAGRAGAGAVRRRGVRVAHRGGEGEKAGHHFFDSLLHEKNMEAIT